MKVATTSAPAVALRVAPRAMPLGLIFGGLMLAAAVAVSLLHLDRLPVTLCVFKLVTGVPCLTCGATRALALLGRGDVFAALAMNPLVSAGALALIGWGVFDLLLVPRRATAELELAPAAWRAARWGAVLAVAANWAYLIASGR